MENESGEIPDASLSFLSQYKHNSNLQELREQILKLKESLAVKGTHVYLCIQKNSFLTPRIVNHSAYDAIKEIWVSHYKAGTPFKFADIGCCFGTDTRKVVADGIRPEDIYSMDVTDEYWNIGLELFDDGDRLKVNTLFTDVARKEFSEDNADLTGKLNVIYTGSVLHVFAEDEVEIFLQNVYEILAKGGTYFGSCAMNSEAHQTEVPTPKKDKRRYIHSPDSLKQLMEKIGFVDVSVRTKVHNIDHGRMKTGLFGGYKARKK